MTRRARRWLFVLGVVWYVGFCVKLLGTMYAPPVVVPGSIWLWNFPFYAVIAWACCGACSDRWRARRGRRDDWYSLENLRERDARLIELTRGRFHSVPPQDRPRGEGECGHPHNP